MMIKDPKKVARIMTIVSILIGIVALAVCALALGLKQWIIAGGMAVVALLQVYNFMLWKKRLK